MEIWDPYAGSVQLVFDVHPQEKPQNGLVGSKLVSIKGKKN